MIDELIKKLRSPRLPSLLRRSVGKVITPRLECFDSHRHLFQDRIGLELGGPSSTFGPRGLFPVYTLASRVDNCNFAAQTVWEGQIEDGHSFQHGSQNPGRQFISEASQLSFVANGTYDFILSSHMLEHSANPIKALREWERVLKPGGALVLFLPHKDATFDHRRPVTPLDHLVSDFELDTGEDDLTHLAEIFSLHDLELDPEAGTPEEFRARSLRNIENRCLHHHVFDAHSAVELIDFVRLQVLAVESVHPCHIAIVVRKVEEAAKVDNRRFMGEEVGYRRNSPFPSDNIPLAGAHRGRFGAATPHSGRLPKSNP